MITQLQVSGYKSIARPQNINFSGLTVLAGTNSSGKSAIMQPLMLWKQTAESSYDPGALLLDGSNVKITSLDQIVSRIKPEDPKLSGCFSISACWGHTQVAVTYKKNSRGQLKIERQVVTRPGVTPLTLIEGGRVTLEDAKTLTEGASPAIPPEFLGMLGDRFVFSTSRDRCFLRLSLAPLDVVEKGRAGPKVELEILGDLVQDLKGIIHIPGLRGNPERTYRATEVGNQFPGTYESYVASIIWNWQETRDQRLGVLGDQLRILGLTWKLTAKRILDTRVELTVGRTPQPSRGGAKDLVSIADVGLGVAQVLPILVALLSARRGQLVYIEQPELHLHPKAQWRLAEIFREAVNRGVKVVVETHSAGFLRGLQTEIAVSRLKNTEVSFNWFTRLAQTGETCLSTCVPDPNGAFGDWPVDFDDVSMEVEGRYLDAVAGGI